MGSVRLHGILLALSVASCQEPVAKTMTTGGSVGAPTASAGSPSARAALSPFERVCARVDRDQRGLLQRARRDASRDHPELLRKDPEYGPGGVAYSGATPRVSPPDGSDEAIVALLARENEAARSAAASGPGGDLSRWILERSPPSRDAFVTVSGSLFPMGACAPSGRGAWSIEATDLAFGAALAWSARLWLVHYDPLFRRTATSFTTCCGGMYDGALQNDRPALFDFDGDGEAEAYLHAIERDKSSEPDEERATIYSFKGDSIVPYAPAARLALFGEPLDADHDGRPDFLTHAGITVTSGPPAACRTEVQRYVPRFLVHSLADGSFSTTDAAAKAYARAWCPGPPGAISDLESAGCARLWASTPQKIAAERARVARSCVEIDPILCERGAPHAPNEVYECHLRSEAFAGTPPFTLP